MADGITSDDRLRIENIVESAADFGELLLLIFDDYLANPAFTDEQRAKIARMRAQTEIQLKDL